MYTYRACSSFNRIERERERISNLTSLFLSLPWAATEVLYFCLFNSLIHRHGITLYFLIGIQIVYMNICICSCWDPLAIWSIPPPPRHLSDVTCPSTQSSNSQRRGSPEMTKEMNCSAPVPPIKGFVNGSTPPDQDERFSHAGSPGSVRNNRVKGGLCLSSPGEFFSFSSFSQSASSSEATLPGALRTCAVGPLCSRKVTPIMLNIMTMQFSSLARASAPQACRVRCCFQGECALSSGRRSSI